VELVKHVVRYALLPALVASLAIFSASCNKSDQSSSSSSGAAGPTTSASADNTAAGGGSTVKVFKASDPNSLKLAFVTNNANGKTEEQNGYLENLLSQGYNGVAVSVIAPNDQIGSVNKVAKRTNVICFDSDCAKSNRILYIGTNNFEAGKTLGAEIVKLLPNGGKMAVFVGTLSADNAAQRLGGIEEAIKGHNIDIVAKKEDATDRAKARSNVEDVINGYSDLNLVCGLWSYNGPAIAAAIEASGKKGKVLAAVFDEEQGTLDGIRSGVINCTCVQKPFQFGYLSSKWLRDLAVQGDAIKLPEGGVIDTGVDIIDAKSVDDFQKKLEAMKAGS
jgi:ribose transport system substrate-binding protein